MSCDGLQALNPLCPVGQAVTGGVTAVADSAFSHIAGFFGTAALDTTNWLWGQIDSATSLDLGSPKLTKELAATAAIAAVLCMGLFLIQVITATLRREPGGLGRAVQGLLISFLGMAFAMASAKLLIAATDALSASVVSYTMGTNIHGIGAQLAFAKLASIQNPAIVLIFAIVILCASVLVWAAMMTRKMMILIAAVLAPLAFSGATADITRSWVRRWIELVAAMIASKLLLVIILCVGVSVLDGAGQAGRGPTQVFTQLAAGSLILIMGGLAPWVAIRMFHFAGDTLYAAHATASQGSAGMRSVAAVPRKVSSAEWQARSLTSYMRGRSPWGGLGGQGGSSLPQQPSISVAAVRATTGAAVGSTAPAAAGGVGEGTTAVVAGAGGAAGVGTVAGGAAAGPAVAAVAVPAVVAVGTVKAANAAQAATTGAAQASVPEPGAEPKPATGRTPPKMPKPPSANP